jgi:hypothetical protein
MNCTGRKITAVDMSRAEQHWRHINDLRIQMSVFSVHESESVYVKWGCAEISVPVAFATERATSEILKAEAWLSAHGFALSRDGD